MYKSPANKQTLAGPNNWLSGNLSRACDPLLIPTGETMAIRGGRIMSGERGLDTAVDTMGGSQGQTRNNNSGHEIFCPYHGLIYIFPKCKLLRMRGRTLA